MRALIAFVISLNGVFLSSNAQQLDPIDNLCIRLDHQSVVKNNTLYVDGGKQTFIDTSTDDASKPTSSATKGYNNYLIAVNLSKSWDWKSNISEIALPKQAKPGSSMSPPVLSRGAVYHGEDSDDNIYLWGGTTSYYNTSFPGFHPPLPSNYSLWSYNIVNKTWDGYDTGSQIQHRPSSGAFTEARELNLGFFFNGQLDSGSDTQTQALGDDPKIFIDGMIVIDTGKKTARNLSTKAVVGDRPRSRGRMQYIKEIGEDGILVTVGGNQKLSNNLNNEYVGDLVPMNSIDVFDVSSLKNSSTPNGIWHKQSAAGEIPAGRIDFCTVLASSTDGSSHNIYVYGGRSDNAKSNVFFDDVYVLSIPSFTWTKLYQGSYPRYGHTCHRLEGRIMLTVGGAPNMNLTKTCDPQTKGVNVFDMSAVQWGSVYDHKAPGYEVPTKLQAVIGGNALGGATVVEPAGGFDEQGLAQMFGATWTPKPTSAPNNKSSNMQLKGAIIGGAIGGVSLISLTASLAFVYRRRIRKLFAGEAWHPEELDGGERAEVEGDIRAEADGKTRAEADGICRVEAEGTEKFEAELTTEKIFWELPAAEKPVELDSSESSDLSSTINSDRRDDRPAWAPPVTKKGVLF